MLKSPHLYVYDPVALHSILVADADSYDEDAMYLSAFGLMWGSGILSSAGEDHRRHRKILNPAFATTKIREMVPVFYEVAERMRDGLFAPLVIDGAQMIDVHPIFSRTSLEITGRAGVGLSFDSMDLSVESEGEYAKTLKHALPALYKFALVFPLIPALTKIGTASFRRFIVDTLPWKALHDARDLADRMERHAVALIADKKAAIGAMASTGEQDAKDVMSLLLRGNLTAQDDMILSDAELVGQTGMIISSAMDTTSTALSRMFHFLARNPAVQDRLREELLAKLDRLDYEGLNALPYLDAFVHEILRLYPPVTPVAPRQVIADTVLPLGTPLVGADGMPIHSISVQKGTTLYIAIAAANHNERIWGRDSRKFNAERWLNPTADSKERYCGMWGNMMTFLGGPRGCIGFQFSLLEMKAVLFVLLRALRFSPAPTDDTVRWRNLGILERPTIHGVVQLPLLVECI